MSSIPRLITASFLFLSISILHADPISTNKVEEAYFSKLDDWVKRGGNINDVQNVIVDTCAKLVMATVDLSEMTALSTTQREEFHFRVDVCTKMTVNRVHPQPEFDKKITLKIICGDSDVILFKKLCHISGFQ